VSFGYPLHLLPTGDSADGDVLTPHAVAHDGHDDRLCCPSVQSPVRGAKGDDETRTLSLRPHLISRQEENAPFATRVGEPDRPNPFVTRGVGERLMGRGAQASSDRSSRRSSCAFKATITVEVLISSAPSAIGNVNPIGVSTPAASGMATML
jgi:hypothetical protein